jgi:drug/metabolite transporter (DMT)-like permease
MLNGMGSLLCLVSAACFGAMAVFAKLAYAAGVSPDALLLARFTLAAVILAVLLLVRPDLRRLPSGPVPTRAVLTGLGLGAVGYALQASLYFAALRRMDASLLSLVFYSYPLLVTAAAVLLGRDRLTPGRTGALVAASGGTLLVLLGAGGLNADPLGVLFAFGAALTYTVYILVADPVVHRLPPVLLSMLVMAGAALTLGARAAVDGGVDLGFGARGWFWVGCVVAVSTVLAMLTFFAGLRRTGPSTAAILSTCEPVVTTALAALFLGESLSAVQLAGGALVLSSAAFVRVGGRRGAPARSAQGLGDVEQHLTGAGRDEGRGVGEGGDQRQPAPAGGRRIGRNGPEHPAVRAVAPVADLDGAVVALDGDVQGDRAVRRGVQGGVGARLGDHQGQVRTAVLGGRGEAEQGVEDLAGAGEGGRPSGQRQARRQSHSASSAAARHGGSTTATARALPAAPGAKQPAGGMETVDGHPITVELKV